MEAMNREQPDTWCLGHSVCQRLGVVISLAFHAALLAACGGGDPLTSDLNGGGTPGSIDTIAPTIAIAAPTSASNYASSTASITVGGNAADNVSVTQVSWSNSLGGSGAASGTTNWSVAGIALQAGTNVITVTARDAGNNTASDTINVSYNDTAPPSIVSTSPLDGATGVSTATVVTATFSEPLDASTVTASTFSIAGVTGTVNFSGNAASFRPTATLASNTTFTATIVGGAGGVRDLAGNPLATSYSWSFTTNNSAGGSGVPNGPYPRLWQDSATTSRLSAAATANSAAWQTLKSFCDTTSTTVPGWSYQGDQEYRYAANFALCYRVARLIALPSATADGYAQKALTVLNNNLLPFTSYSNDSGYGIRNYGPALAMVYDWLYDHPSFTTALKASTRTRMKAWIDWYNASGYANQDYISNYNAGFMAARVLAGVVMYDEDAGAASYFNNAISHYNAAVLLFDQKMPGGHWPEGWNYGAGAYENYGLAGSGLRVATGDANYTNSQWFSNNILLKLNAVSGDGKYFYDDGAWTGMQSGFPDVKDMYVAGYLVGWGSSNGRLAASYVNLVRNVPGVDNSTVVGEWKRFLFYDPSAAAADLSAVTPSYLANGTGLVTMRSGWNAANATLGTMIAGPYLSYQGSQDMDQGHIEIYKNSSLLIDAGHDLYGDAHTNGTIHHNTFTLRNRSGVSYDGQREFAITANCPNSPLGVKAFLDAGTWVFTSGDITDSYRPEPDWTGTCRSPGISRLIRNVFYLRPNLFFIYDQVEKLASQAQVSPHLHLHFPTLPATVDANRQLTVTNGTGVLHVATVFPSNAVATLAANSASGAVVPGWHLDVSAPSESPLYHRFLHLLRAAETTGSYTYPQYGAISGTAAFGTWVDGLTAAEASGRQAVVFADDGTTTIPASLSYQLPAVSTRHHVLKLKPSTRYDVSTVNVSGTVTVTVTENAAGALQTNAVGLLTFTN